MTPKKLDSIDCVINMGKDRLDTKCMCDGSEQDAP